MSFRFDEYRAAVLQDYELRKAANNLRFGMDHPTAVTLRDEAIFVCTSRFKRSDEKVLATFFKSHQDQTGYVSAITEINVSCFKPLINFIKGRTQKPEERVVELLAWLTDFEARPYQHYIVVTPEGGKPITALIDAARSGSGVDEGQVREYKSQQSEVGSGKNGGEIEARPSSQKRWSMAWKNAILILLAFPWVLWMLAPKPAPPGSVYICDSQGAKRYHLRKNCGGLRNCKHEIITVSLDSAKKTGRTLCHLEGG
ncbi:hypothetical protein [Mucilaginibacter gossypii]|uniref:Uncharacterized protein n=1 Tax=Mucilaginibacter gossypii TaxID=551996 RepID=A0A1G8A5U0_9SPHI|nr:hypothetical protein [Mucilaginibacter gossypii]SDH16324.1 hypothetical protein SAMN05192573_107102 [Mucilaginibacter gossypii]